MHSESVYFLVQAHKEIVENKIEHCTIKCGRYFFK